MLARKGSTAAGEQLVREAWEIAEPTQFLNNKAGAAEAVAEVLSLAGKKEESAVYLRRALELREQKGNRIMADRPRARLELLFGCGRTPKARSRAARSCRSFSSSL